jgi:hypothetical protein
VRARRRLARQLPCFRIQGEPGSGHESGLLGAEPGHGVAGAPARGIGGNPGGVLILRWLTGPVLRDLVIMGWAWERLTFRPPDIRLAGRWCGVKHQLARAPQRAGRREHSPQQVQGHGTHQAQHDRGGTAQWRPGRFRVEREDVLADDRDHLVGDDRQEHRGRRIRSHGPPADRVRGGEVHARRCARAGHDQEPDAAGRLARLREPDAQRGQDDHARVQHRRLDQRCARDALLGQDELALGVEADIHQPHSKQR